MNLYRLKTNGGETYYCVNTDPTAAQAQLETELNKVYPHSHLTVVGIELITKMLVKGLSEDTLHFSDSYAKLLPIEIAK